MTLTQDKDLQTGIVGSVAVHVILLFLLTLGVLNSEAGRELLRPKEKPKKENKVVLLSPQLFIKEPPVPKPPEKKYFIRTSQNEASATAPANAMFESDRNTRASSMLPPEAGATLPLPSTQGSAPVPGQLANRDYADGQLRNDSAMLNKTQQEPPIPSPPPPQTAPPPQSEPPLPQTTAAAEPPLSAPDRLPLEVRKADPKPTESAAPQPKADPAPQVRVPDDAPPPVLPPAVRDPVTQNTRNPEQDSFSPFTRTSKTAGAISREGEDAVDAKASPMGRYTAQVYGEINKKWQQYRLENPEAFTYGVVRFKFYVDRRGKVQELEVTSDSREADVLLRNMTSKAIIYAEIPPIPPDLLPTLEDGRVKFENSAIVY